MITYLVTKMIWQFFDTLIVASTDKEWLKRSLLFNLISITAVSYGGIAINLSIKLQKLQNHAARILTSSVYDTNADDLFVRLGWQKLNLQRELKVVIIVNKSLNGIASHDLKSMFTDWSATSTYSLRNREGKLALSLPRTNYLKKTVSAMVVRCCGTAYLPICGKHRRLLVLNLAVEVSFLVIIKLINHTAFMESRHLLLFLFLLLLDLISSRLVS